MERDEETTSPGEETPHTPDSTQSPRPKRDMRPVRGRWTWPNAGGYRVDAGTPCPICEGDSNCQVAEEGAVLCSRSGDVAVKSTVESPITHMRYEAGKPSTAQHTRGHRMYYPIDAEGKAIKAPTLTPEQLAARRAREIAEREILVEFSKAEYGRACEGDPRSSANVNHPMVVALSLIHI